MTADQEQAYEEWLGTRPAIIQDLGRKFRPGSWWINKLTPDVAVYTPYSFAEDGTLTMDRLSTFYQAPIYRVFGMNPEELEAVSETDSRVVAALRIAGA